MSFKESISYSFFCSFDMALLNFDPSTVALCFFTYLKKLIEYKSFNKETEKRTIFVHVLTGSLLYLY